MIRLYRVGKILGMTGLMTLIGLSAAAATLTGEVDLGYGLQPVAVHYGELGSGEERIVVGQDTYPLYAKDEYHVSGHRTLGSDPVTLDEELTILTMPKLVEKISKEDPEKFAKAWGLLNTPRCDADHNALLVVRDTLNAPHYLGRGNCLRLREQN
jgi:hypothetical protein